MMRRREFITGVVGAAAPWPLAARAQPATDRVVWVHPSAPLADMREEGNTRPYRAFLNELLRLGHIEGKNLILERYSGEGRRDEFGELARVVVERRPTVIFTSGTDMARKLIAATDTIPIVAVLTDPVATGLITNLAHPGSNITGTSVDAGLEIWSKRLELLKGVVPSASRVAFLSSRTFWEDAGRSGEASRAAAPKLGLTLSGCLLDDTGLEADYRRAFATLSQARPDALIVNEQAEHFTNRKIIVELAQQARLPAIYPYREYVELGGLMAYTVDLANAFRLAAQQIDQILKGTKPSELPFYQQTKFELVINLITAKALGVTLRPDMLALADEVIE